MKLLILCVDFILWAQHSFMWKHWWFQQSQTETCKNVVRIKVRCTVSFEEKNNLFTISWPDTKEVFFCFTFFFKVQYNQLHFLQNERGAGFFSYYVPDWWALLVKLEENLQGCLADKGKLLWRWNYCSCQWQWKRESCCTPQLKINK